MRNNQPVSQREYEIDGDVTLMSTTDTQSHLTYANAAFVNVSGFEPSELIGQPHNVVRHPDMPPEAFADMWATLKDGESWTALVKNRRKNGDHYWVRANATPIRRGGQVVGYMSVRTKPGRDEVAAAEALYREFREGRAGSRVFHKGLVVRRGLLRVLSTLQLMSTRTRLVLPVVGVAGAAAATAALGAGGWIVAGAVATLALGAGVWLERQIAAPLVEVLRRATAVAAGQTEATPPMNRVDAIGMLARAVTQGGLNLRSLLDDVSIQVGGVRTASGEIAQGNADLSVRTEQAASSLQQTSASMTQIASTLSGNAGRSRDAESLAREASSTAEQGNQDVSRVAKTMQEIEASSRRIAEIIGLIDSIAFQTNILALNAAVEAARAGEQGRGFAVVAGEVRTLAQRSASAARDIKGLIQTSVDSVENGAGLVKQAGATMDRIVDRVRKVSMLIEEIAHATGEQSVGVGQVETAISQLDQVTQQNAALVEESAAAAESLKAQAGRLAEAVGAFATTR